MRCYRTKLRSSDNLELSSVMAIPNEGKNFPCVVAFHGFESTKDSTKYIMLENKFVDSGIAFLRFDFRGCGESLGDKYDIDGRFDDALSAIRFARNFDNIDKSRIGVLGSSFGGSLAAVVSLYEELRFIIMLATPAVVKIKGIATKDVFSKGNNPPVLFVHGDSDELVPMESSVQMYAVASEPKKIEIIRGADHRFSDKNHLLYVVQLCGDWAVKYI